MICLFLLRLYQKRFASTLKALYAIYWASSITKKSHPDLEGGFWGVAKEAET